MQIAVSGGKGGTGKSTVAINLTIALAERYDLALADLDVERRTTTFSSAWNPPTRNRSNFSCPPALTTRGVPAAGSVRRFARSTR